MPAIYTTEWYEAVREAINASVAGIKGVPEGAWTCRVEIIGDSASPYVQGGAERHFLVRIESGLCSWYREVDPGDEAMVLDYRFRGPAAVFDAIAAGIDDPIDAALRGAVKVRGDMRFLMRQADLVKTLLDAYATAVDTTWPRGRPPYEGSTGGSPAGDTGGNGGGSRSGGDTGGNGSGSRSGGDIGGNGGGSRSGGDTGGGNA